MPKNSKGEILINLSSSPLLKGKIASRKVERKKAIQSNSDKKLDGPVKANSGPSASGNSGNSSEKGLTIQSNNSQKGAVVAVRKEQQEPPALLINPNNTIEEEDSMLFEEVKQ
jgi:hypothetical protein